MARAGVCSALPSAGACMGGRTQAALLTLVVLGLALVCGTAAGASAPGKPRKFIPSSLAQCMREGQEQDVEHVPLTWDRVMNDETGVLHVRRIWWSNQRSNLPITVVTQLSTSRLPQLEAQCRSWPGPLSAAIYVPLIEIQDEDGDEAQADQAGDDVTAEQQREHVLHEMQAALAVTRHTRKALTGLLHQYERQLGEQGRPVMDRVGVSPSAGAYKEWEQPEDEYKASGISPQNRKVMQLAERAVAALLATVERQPLGCQLDVVLVYEILADVRTANLLYPVNQLRNLARLQARTELVAQLDVDMLIGWDAAAWLRTGHNTDAMIEACRNQSVYIMPAFEVHASDIEESAALSDKFSALPKSRLEKAVQSGIISHFDANRFPQGHNTTDFPRWFKASESYQITYTYRLEPWLIVHRTLAPWHDVRFRGYGNNKIQQVCHLNASNYNFLVHPAAFIIHRAHPLTGARLQLTSDLETLRAQRWKGFNGTLYGHNELMMRRLRKDMEAGTFVPMLDAPTQRCIDVLPWMTQSRKDGKNLLLS